MKHIPIWKQAIPIIKMGQPVSDWQEKVLGEKENTNSKRHKHKQTRGKGKRETPVGNNGKG